MSILMGNPMRTTGFFHATLMRLRHRWHTRRVSSAEVPRARGHIGDIIATYGEGSNKYRIQSWVSSHPSRVGGAARDREVVISSLSSLGCDPARFGRPKRVLPCCLASVVRSSQDAAVNPVEGMHIVRCMTEFPRLGAALMWAASRDEAMVVEPGQPLYL